MIERIIPILAVDRIEDALPFWVGRLGFEVVSEVEHEGALGFVMLKRGALILELQSRVSIATDVPELAPLAGVATIYLPVTDLAEIERRLEGHHPVIVRRDTFYGMRELIVREPCGHFVFFGQRIAEPEASTP